jgi:hypothetical protein
MQRIVRAGCTAAVLMTAGTVQADGGSFVCEDGFGTSKEITAQVGGSFGFQKIVHQYVARWDAQKARQLCEAYAGGEPVTITCLDGRRDWAAIKASIPSDYYGRSNESLASANEAERRQGNGFKEAMAYCRSVGAIE